MPTLTLKNIPTPLHRRLVKRAKSHRRSLNSEVLACLEEATGSSPIDTQSLIESARKLRQNFKAPLTPETLIQYKNLGRL